MNCEGEFEMYYGNSDIKKKIHLINVLKPSVPLSSVLTHWHTQPAVRRAEPSMPLLLILALGQ
jgi:hypothetical protein